MTTHSHIRRLPARRAGLSGLVGFARKALAAWRQRRALERLDDAALDDIGISHRQAQAEYRRPVWDVPAHWRR